MQLHLKNNTVNLDGLSIDAVYCIYMAMYIFIGAGEEAMTITSAYDGEHKTGSKHYSGDAIDIRTRNLKDPRIVRDRLQAILGRQYDVILEKDHLHIEYDPK